MFGSSNGICSGLPTKWLFIHCFQIELELEVLIFEEGGKPENPEKNPRSKDENQQQTQPTYDAGSGIQSNPGHSGGRRVVSPLPHAYSPAEIMSICLNNMSALTNMATHTFLTRILKSPLTSGTLRLCQYRGLVEKRIKSKLKELDKHCKSFVTQKLAQYFKSIAT